MVSHHQFVPGGGLIDEAALARAVAGRASPVRRSMFSKSNRCRPIRL